MSEKDCSAALEKFARTAMEKNEIDSRLFILLWCIIHPAVSTLRCRSLQAPIDAAAATELMRSCDIIDALYDWSTSLVDDRTDCDAFAAACCRIH